MRTYLITTAIVFGLGALVHIARLVAEGPGPATHPMFVLTTIAAAGLCGWAVWLLRRDR